MCRTSPRKRRERFAQFHFTNALLIRRAIRRRFFIYSVLGPSYYAAWTDLELSYHGCAIPAQQQLQNYLGGHDVVSSTNPAAPKTSSGAPATTRAVTETDTAVPETTSVALKTTPPPPPATVDNSFMWVEFPEIYDPHQLGAYYDEVYNHVMGNHIGMRYSQVVVRVTTPDDALTGTRSSPLYTHLLNRIAGKLSVICYPDLETAHGKRDQWLAASPMGSFLDGVIEYAARNGDVFTGVVYDTEEFAGTPSYNSLLNHDNSEIRMAAPNGLTTALTCGFDEVTRPDNRGSIFLETVDHLYLQMFDFYNDAGVPIASSPVTTPFVTYVNDALVMYNYLFSGKSDVTAVKYTENSYVQYSQEGKISMMWSTSFNTSPNCMQPLNGQCGDSKAHYEFGVWDGVPFVNFASRVKADYPNTPQGIMQFAFMPESWE
ncbi:hypothetical protein FOZ63_001412 [Perkinsus olseni]|uniref:Uncharacterized protein n=1 Tax=Perkinsus olseni TaxID=32597 RepID=A0A7J6SP71_PEROL|nr:hypothetical protein FOZ63_001412 [Perkinsus olseni]